MLKSFTNCSSVKALSTKAREDSCRGLALAKVHKELGSLLAYEIFNDLPVEECMITHPNGQTSGYRLSQNIRPAILAVMRAGLFTAEGIWEVLPQSALILQYPNQPVSDPFLQHDTNLVILADSVINTGETIVSLIEAFKEKPHIKLIVASLVCYEKTANDLGDRYSHVDFYFSRISKNTYVGQGNSDTGARLFNKINSSQR
jgi:uracil phosphoribosyltransferase